MAQDPDRPLTTEVTDDQFLYLGPAGGVRLPNLFMPKLMNNHGNFVGSLGNRGALSRPQGGGARRRDLSGLPGRECSRRRRQVVGIATGDMGIGRDGEPQCDFTRGMELRAKYTIFAEGARGSLTKQLVAPLRPAMGATIRNTASASRKSGRSIRRSTSPAWCSHTMGWPLPTAPAAAPGFIISTTTCVSVGFVVHLNYENPTLSPFDEFQRFKTHPMIRDVFEGAKRIGYGGRAIVEGGWQSVPKLVFPGRLPGRRSRRAS